MVKTFNTGHEDGSTNKLPLVFERGHLAAAYLASQNDTSVVVRNVDGCLERWNAEKACFEFKWEDEADWKDYSFTGKASFNEAPYTLVEKLNPSLTFEQAMACEKLRLLCPLTKEDGVVYAKERAGYWYPSDESVIAYFCEKAKTDSRYRVVEES